MNAQPTYRKTYYRVDVRALHTGAWTKLTDNYDIQQATTAARDQSTVQGRETRLVRIDETEVRV